MIKTAFIDFAKSSFDQASQIVKPQSSSNEALIPSSNPPRSLVEWAILILNTGDPGLKVLRTRHVFQEFSTGKLNTIGRSTSLKPPDQPPRPNLIHVDPSKAGKRGKAGSLKNRIAMLHALANIEQWAVDLAYVSSSFLSYSHADTCSRLYRWDIIARFASTPSLPHQFFTDFAQMALDESKHFSLLSARLSTLGTPYGTLPIHSALWESALKTSHSLRSRLAIIHLVHEARGLDVNPSTIAKFSKAGDEESVKVLEIIHKDEVTHVTTGHRWFTWLCAREEESSPWRDPVKAFRREVKEHFSGGLKGPFNVNDRRKAGLTPDFYEVGVGIEDESEVTHEKAGGVGIGYTV